MNDLVAEGRFLLDRINDLDWACDFEEFARQWCGHVDPPLSRFTRLIEAAEQSTPAGMVMVPREPTEAMLGCGFSSTEFSFPEFANPHAEMRKAWAAMIAAAPDPAKPVSTPRVTEECKKLVQDLAHIDRKGGLGYEAHDTIRRAVDFLKTLSTEKQDG